MTKLRFSTAQQIIDTYPVLRDEFQSAALDANPLEFIKGLVETMQGREALALCAFMLPRREAVAWLCQTLRQHAGKLNASDEHLLQLAEDWVLTPVEKNRNAALHAVMTSGFRTGPAWAAAAAGWSGGSMLEASEHPLPPPAHLTGQAVKMGLVLTFWSTHDEGRHTKVADTVGRAISIVQGA